jgi:hypothetical protein
MSRKLDNPWFRSRHGLAVDNKWRLIAKIARVQTGTVTSIWWALMNHASQAEPRGSVADFDAESYAYFSDYTLDEVKEVLTALRAKGMLHENMIKDWERDQPLYDATAAERKRRSRASKAAHDEGNELGDEDDEPAAVMAGGDVSRYVTLSHGMSLDVTTDKIKEGQTRSELDKTRSDKIKSDQTRENNKREEQIKSHEIKSDQIAAHAAGFKESTSINNKLTDSFASAGKESDFISADNRLPSSADNCVKLATLTEIDSVAGTSNTSNRANEKDLSPIRNDRVNPIVLTKDDNDIRREVIRVFGRECVPLAMRLLQEVGGSRAALMAVLRRAETLPDHLRWKAIENAIRRAIPPLFPGQERNLLDETQLTRDDVEWHCERLLGRERFNSSMVSKLVEATGGDISVALSIVLALADKPQDERYPLLGKAIWRARTTREAGQKAA